MKIILATDGSVHSEFAARRLAEMRPPADSKVFVTYVVEPPQYWVTPAVPPPYHSELQKVQLELVEEAHEVADKSVRRTMEVLGSGLATDSIVGEGHASEEIVGIAEEKGADLVVVGSEGVTGARLFFLGSVSLNVLRYAHCSVLVTKPPVAGALTGVRKTLLATDGSDNAYAAAEFLSKFQLGDDAEINVLHVLPKLPLPSKAVPDQPTLVEFQKLRVEAAEQVLDETVSRLASGLKTNTLIREGDPANEVLKASTEIGADLVVVGSKGLSGIKMFLLGSVSRKVAKHAETSVLVVKQAE